MRMCLVPFWCQANGVTSHIDLIGVEVAECQLSKHPCTLINLTLYLCAASLQAGIISMPVEKD